MARRYAWQSEERRCTLVTVHHPLLWGRGLALTRIFRKLPTGSVDLMQPVLTHATLWSSEREAERQHLATWQALQAHALPEVDEALFAAEDLPPLVLPQHGAVPTPN